MKELQQLIRDRLGRSKSCSNSSEADWVGEEAPVKESVMKNITFHLENDRVNNDGTNNNGGTGLRYCQAE